MAITLQTIKQFISDNANSMADTAASRVMDRIVQDTLLLLGREHEWSFLRVRERFVTAPPESFTNVVNATQDSGVFVLSTGAWLSKYVTQKWELVVEGAADQPYTASALSTTTNANDTWTSTTGQAWTNATATGLDATLYRTRYQTTNKIKRLVAARLLGPTRVDLPVFNRDEFEELSRLFTQSTGQTREVVAIDPTEVAVFPLPDQRYDVELDMVRKITVPAEGADDATELDWPDEMQDLLRAAIRMQLIERLGDEAVTFDAPMASSRYQRLLSGYKREQGRRNVGSFSLRPMNGYVGGDDVRFIRSPAT